jgi:uncharacterized membrane protein (UPF0127 family)
MIGFVRRGLFLGLGLLFSALALASAAQPRKPLTPLEIASGGKVHKFNVEVVVSAEDMARGLMNRREMAADAGMLFDYKTEQGGVSFWMKNTFIPLDMIFIKADGTILNIHERAIPHDETPIAAAGPVRAVLELNGGTASRLSIRPGDKVRHAVFAAGK